MSKEHDYWKTIEYLGEGFVLQRAVDDDGSTFIEWYREDRDQWHRGSTWSSYPNARTRIPERIIHVNDTEIDTSTIDQSKLR